MPKRDPDQREGCHAEIRPGAGERDPKTWEEAVKHMAATDPYPRSRAFALRVLMGYADSSLEPFFREGLQQDEDPHSRGNAAEALGRFKSISPESKEALRKAETSDTSEKVR